VKAEATDQTLGTWLDAVRKMTDEEFAAEAPGLAEAWARVLLPDTMQQLEDPDFRAAGREHVYYVRAIQEPTPAVNGDPLRCERDAAGRCVKTRPCYASGPDFDPDDECLAPVEERAWSSPIFVSPSR